MSKFKVFLRGLAAIFLTALLSSMICGVLFALFSAVSEGTSRFASTNGIFESGSFIWVFGFFFSLPPAFVMASLEWPKAIYLGRHGERGIATQMFVSVLFATLIAVLFLLISVLVDPISVGKEDFATSALGICLLFAFGWLCSGFVWWRIVVQPIRKITFPAA